jgi:hypothetical protein
MSVEWTEEKVLPYMFKLVEFSGSGEKWIKEKLCGYSHSDALSFVDSMGLSYRYMRPIVEKRKVVEPWTWETCPWPLSLQHKGNDPEFLTFSTKRSTGVLCAGTLYTYEYLTEFFKQLDGSPCGIVREVDA